MRSHDNTETYHFTIPEVSTSTSVQIPQKWLRSWIANPEEGVARVFTRDCPWGNTLIAMLDALTLGISKRYLHSLFAASGTTFCKELMSLRLERAARQLRDPQFANVSVSEIAWRCGFADSSHFARRFCQRYGTPPREYRRSVLS
jgi:AraC-like DNA-binding protein